MTFALTRFNPYISNNPLVTAQRHQNNLWTKRPVTSQDMYF